jgi:diacylglycerol kinase family enzyme
VVSERFANSGKRGLLNYIEQGLRTWKEYIPDKYVIDIDGKRWENDAALITVGNSSQWGNNAKIAPLADISDGILDVTVVEEFKNIEIPFMAGLLMTGAAHKSMHVHTYKGREITITRQKEGPAHADGDWFETGTTLKIKIIPQALKVIIP